MVFGIDHRFMTSQHSLAIDRTCCIPPGVCRSVPFDSCQPEATSGGTPC